MKYLKALDEKCEQYSVKSNYFETFINYITDEDLETVLKNFFGKIKELHMNFEDFNYEEEEDELKPETLCFKD